MVSVGREGERERALSRGVFLIYRAGRNRAAAITPPAGTGETTTKTGKEIESLVVFFTFAVFSFPLSEEVFLRGGRWLEGGQ